jgi:hypothetical protein
MLAGVGLICLVAAASGWWHWRTITNARDFIVAAGGRVTPEPTDHCPAWIESAFWPMISEIESIDLKGAQLSPNVMHAIGALEPTELDLSGCKLSAELLGDVPQSTQLRQLWLTNTPTNDAMLETITQRCPNLTVLSLNRTAVGDAGIDTLRHCK